MRTLHRNIIMLVNISLPNDFVALQPLEDIEREIRLSYALWLFKNSRVTLAKAAELTGVDIYEFIKICKQNSIAIIDITKDELLEEIESMKQ